MSTIPKARIAASAPATPRAEGTEDKPAEPVGWDPYEVWRTRVLLPRLQESAATEERKKPEPSPKPYLLPSR